MAYVSIINKHGQVTVPKAIRRARGWKAGTRISIIEVDSSSFILRAAEMPQSKPELVIAASIPVSDARELAGHARMLLEKLGLDGDHRTSAIEVEIHLVTILRTSGEWALKVLFGQAAAIAESIEAESALTELHAIICALLGKRPHDILETDAGRAAAQGM